MKKRTKVLILTLAIIISMMDCIRPASAADSGSTYRFTHYPQEDITFTLSKGSLTISNLPNTAAFSSILIFIINDDGRAQAEVLLNRGADGSASMSIRYLEDGYYNIALYFSINGDERTAYAFCDMRFRWSEGAGIFVDPPTLEHNRTTYDAGRKDDAALAYYLKPTSNVQSTDAVISRLAKDITYGISSDYEKALAIHDWICANLWYDIDAAEGGKRTAWDAVTTLNNRYAVCEGFSNLTAAFLRAVDIPAKTVHGCGRDISITGMWSSRQLSGNEINHSWNEAYVGDRWVIIDTTWDCGNEYENSRFAVGGGIFSHRYFDATIEAFSSDHRIQGYAESSIPQPDYPSSWAQPQVSAAISAGLVPQILKVRYSQPITRAEFCVLAVKLYENMTGVVFSGRQAFIDTNDIYVEKAAAINLVDGVGDNRFAPDEILTREQAATMLARLAGALGAQLPAIAPTFVDSSRIASWAYGAVGQIQAAGIMSGVGDNSFSPKELYTREQSIATIFRLYSILAPVNVNN